MILEQKHSSLSFIFIAAMLTAAAPDFYRAIMNLIWTRDWASIPWANAYLQATLLMLLAPFISLTILFTRFKYSFLSGGRNILIAIFGSMTIAYFAVFATHILIGDIKPLIDHLERDPFGRIVVFLIAIYFVSRALFQTLKAGKGFEKR